VARIELKFAYFLAKKVELKFSYFYQNISSESVIFLAKKLTTFFTFLAKIMSICSYNYLTLCGICRYMYSYVKFVTVYLVKVIDLKVCKTQEGISNSVLIRIWSPIGIDVNFSDPLHTGVT
jgi:hypothetical protein